MMLIRSLRFIATKSAHQQISARYMSGVMIKHLPRERVPQEHREYDDDTVVTNPIFTDSPSTPVAIHENPPVRPEAFYSVYRNYIIVFHNLQKSEENAMRAEPRLREEIAEKRARASASVEFKEELEDIEDKHLHPSWSTHRIAKDDIKNRFEEDESQSALDNENEGKSA